MMPMPGMQAGTYNSLSATPEANMMSTNRFGGPVYDGNPDLGVTASFVAAGGGQLNFSMYQVFKNIGGQNFADDEMARLRSQFGSDKVAKWLDVFNFSVADASLISQRNGVTLPLPTLSGPALGLALVNAGLDGNRTFYEGYQLDKAVSHPTHWRVMRDVDSEFGEHADMDYHAITDKAFIDIAAAVGEFNVHQADIDSMSDMSPAPEEDLNSTVIMNTTPGMSNTPVLNTLPNPNPVPGS
jgi:hypothetical protein